MLELHGDKRALAAGVLEGTDAGARLSNRDLVQLLEHGLSNAAAGDAPAAPAASRRSKRHVQSARKQSAGR